MLVYSVLRTGRQEKLLLIMGLFSTLFITVISFLAVLYMCLSLFCLLVYWKKKSARKALAK